MESRNFAVTIFDHHFPSNYKAGVLPDPLFGLNVLRSSIDRQIIGFRITWTYILANKNEKILHYEAIDDYTSENILSVKAAELQGIIRLSHLKYRKEFDRLKQQFGLIFVIPHYKEGDINYPQLLELFRE